MEAPRILTPGTGSLRQRAIRTQDTVPPRRAVRPERLMQPMVLPPPVTRRTQTMPPVPSRAMPVIALPWKREVPRAGMITARMRGTRQPPVLQPVGTIMPDMFSTAPRAQHRPMPDTAPE
jgi:hypothetical protein